MVRGWRRRWRRRWRRLGGVGVGVGVGAGGGVGFGPTTIARGTDTNEPPSQLRLLHARAVHVNAPADAALTLTLNTAVSPPTSTSSSCSARYSATRDEPVPPLCPVFQCLPDGTETSFTSLSSKAPGIETSTHPIPASSRTPRLVTVSWTVASLFAEDDGRRCRDRPKGDRRHRGRTRQQRGNREQDRARHARATSRDQATRCAGSHSGIREIVSGRGASETCSMPSMNAPTSRSSS